MHMRFIIIWFAILSVRCEPNKHIPAPETGQHLAAILCLHDIGGKGKYSISSENFHYLLENLQNRFAVISLQSWFDSFMKPDQFNKPVIILTFDDGYPSLRNMVIPELRKYGFGATFFIYLDRYNDNSPFFKDLAALEKQFEIGSHSFSHENLIKMYEKDERKFFREVYLSRRKLEYLTGKKITSWAWPYGYYNDKLVEITKNAGYAIQTTTDYQITDLPLQRKHWPRFTLKSPGTKKQIDSILKNLSERKIILTGKKNFSP